MGTRLGRAVWIFVFLVVFIVAAITAGVGVWPWPLLQHLPADTRIPLLGFLSNLVLVAITWAYVLITREQLKELQSTRWPNVVLHIRVPEFDMENVKYGRGSNAFRTGPPIYLDVWNMNMGTPTIMVTRVRIRVTGSKCHEDLNPQIAVEAGKLASINVAYALMRLTSSMLQTDPAELLTFPDNTAIEAQFDTVYFSSHGERTVQMASRFLFRVSDEYINTIAQ